MCIANVCTLPCRHIRLTPEFCEWARKNSFRGSLYIEANHPEPILTKQIEDPADSVCLCQLGVTLEPETAEQPGTVLIYEKVDDVLLSSFSRESIERPIYDAIAGAKAQKPDEWTRERIIPETRSSPVESDYRIHYARQLWFAGGMAGAFYACRHTNMQDNTGKELTEVPAICEEPGCGSRVKFYNGVIDEDLGPNASSIGTWRIHLRDVSE